MSAPPPPEPPPLVRPLSQLTPRPVAWLWPERLPLGKLALLKGDAGVGKSLVALDLCARLSTGRPMPDRSPGPEPAAPLGLIAEDNGANAALPRLLALGSGPGRVFSFPRDGPAGWPLRLPAHAALLSAAVRHTRARLVVLDPVTAFLGTCALHEQGV